MTNAQKRLAELKAKQSQQRQRMAELGLAESLTDETRAELDAIEAGTPDLERQIRAAAVAVENEEASQTVETRDNDGPDAEMRERLELRGKASLTNYLQAFSQGRLPSGAEAELSAAAGVQAIPLELWDVARPERRDENRADTATGAPGTVGVNLDPIRPRVFAASIAPTLGIEMPRVASGTFASATISTSLTAGAKAAGAAQEATAAAFRAATATPKRVSARMSVRLEDIASVGAANFESALRENLALVLSDELDDQAISGDGTAPNLTGILARLADPTAPTAVVKFDDFISAYADGVDGLWAATVRQIGMIVGVDTYRLAAKAFRDDADGDSLGSVTAANFCADMTGGFRTNKRMPAHSSNIQAGILHRMGRPGIRTAVCPHWGEVGIDDIYSGSASGERYFTFHVLLGDVILVQPDAYAQVSFKVA